MESDKNNSTEEKNILFTKWLYYQKVINQIENNPIYSQYKELLKESKEIDNKIKIIHSFIFIYHLNQWLKIENYLEVKDIIHFNNSTEYLNQFN
jgi:hypothetical protein